MPGFVKFASGKFREVNKVHLLKKRDMALNTDDASKVITKEEYASRKRGLTKNI